MGTATSWPADYVLLPVPLAHAARVAEFAAGLANHGAAAAFDADEHTVYVTNQGTWTRAELQLLHGQLHYAGVIALLDQCAATNDWVAKHEIETALGITAIQLRNELGAFSKLTRRLLGDVRWPMEWRKVRGVFQYRMDPNVAAWWREMQEATS